MKTTFIFFKNSILLFIFLCSNITLGQENQLKQIDSFLHESEKKHSHYNHLEELQIAKKANVLAKKIGDDQRIAESNYIISRALASLELPKESLSYIQKSLNQKYTQKNILLQAKFKEIKAYDFYVLSLKSQSSQELKSILKLLKNKTDTASARILARIHTNIANQYFDKNSIDSAFIYYRTAGNFFGKLNEKSAHNTIAEYYIALGNAFSQKKDFDSAFHYYQKSYDLKTKYKDPIIFMQYITFGNYYRDQKKYNVALDYYLKALQNIKEYSINITPFNSLNKNIADVYGALDDKEKQSLFENIYTNKESEIAATRSESMDYALSIIVDDKENKYETSEKKKYIWIFVGIVALVLFFFFIYSVLRKNLKQKETIFSEVHGTLQEKEEIISQKTVETQELQLKVNEAYNEVCELAKNNDPNFYSRFLEVYPDFQKKLLEYSPGLRTSELILCAYTFLGFNIKDIADYTFKSINTVRNRKQNLRKKFLIPTEQDMGMWLRNVLANPTGKEE